ncbi:MAG: hypothetical protein ACXVSF_11955 [Solirubrobacteraceae bacterium]
MKRLAPIVISGPTVDSNDRLVWKLGLLPAAVSFDPTTRVADLRSPRRVSEAGQVRAPVADPGRILGGHVWGSPRCAATALVACCWTHNV